VSRGGAVAVLLAAVVVLLAGEPAWGHGRSVSYSVWTFDGDGGVRVRARISRLELTRIALDPVGSPADSERVASLLAGRLRLFAGDAPCSPVAPPRAAPAEKGWVVYAWSLHCPDPGQRRLQADLFLDFGIGHLHFARVSAGERDVERVLTEAEPVWLVEQAVASSTGGPTAGTGVAGYVGLGIEHILTGWDHLAFVFALMLLATRVRELALLITSFTAAHSVTLGLAALGLVHPDGHVVEAIIGFSIALVAAENSWILGGRDRVIPVVCVGALLLLAASGLGNVPRQAVLGLAAFTLCHFALLRDAPRPVVLRAAVAFAFGLVHGFGFAGVLGELELSLDRMVPALLGFNVGVEVGQLAVVAVVWPLLRGLARLGGGGVERAAAEAASAAVCGLGVYWFVTRSFA